MSVNALEKGEVNAGKLMPQAYWKPKWPGRSTLKAVNRANTSILFDARMTNGAGDSSDFGKFLPLNKDWLCIAAFMGFGHTHDSP